MVKYYIIVACTVLSILCQACQNPLANQQHEKFLNYYQKPMRNLDIQLMDEVLEYVSDDIKDLLDTINDASKRESVRLLLVGGPGVGKTTLAQAIAMQTNRPCFIIRAPSLANQYQFSGEQNLISAISPLFDINEPCVVIIDEIDALKQYKGDKNNQDSSPANTLCNLLDDAEDHPNIVFIATTNKLKQLPEDLKSRFGSIITLPLPDKFSRERIIRYHLEQLEKAGINITIDETIIKSLAEKTSGFSARELKAMIMKCKIYARGCGLRSSSPNVEEKHVWQAYKDEKALIGSNWHVTERLKEFIDHHGVTLATCAISSAIGVLGIVLSVRKSAQSMEQSQKQYREQQGDQKNIRKKEKRAKLLREIIAQEKLLKDEKVQNDLYEEHHVQFMLNILKCKLARNIANPGSKEEIFFKNHSKYLKQILVLHENILDHRLYAKVHRDKHFFTKIYGSKRLNLTLKVCCATWYQMFFSPPDWGGNAVINDLIRNRDQCEDKFKEFVCSEFKISTQEFVEYVKNIHAKYDQKLAEMVAVARSNENAAEVNAANERSQAAARERGESWLDRFVNSAINIAGSCGLSYLLNKWGGGG